MFIEYIKWKWRLFCWINRLLRKEAIEYHKQYTILYTRSCPSLTNLHESKMYLSVCRLCRAHWAETRTPNIHFNKCLTSQLSSSQCCFSAIRKYIHQLQNMSLNTVCQIHILTIHGIIFCLIVYYNTCSSKLLKCVVTFSIQVQLLWAYWAKNVMLDCLEDVTCKVYPLITRNSNVLQLLQAMTVLPLPSVTIGNLFSCPHTFLFY